MPSSINVITRAEWMARPPINSEKLRTPVDKVLITYTGSKDYLTHKEVLNMLAGMQQSAILMDHRYDIPYNWLIDYNGYIYEGRGWRVNVEKLTDNPYHHLNGKSLDIGLIGNFAKKKVPRSMERVVTKLLEWGMAQKFVVDTRQLKIYNWKDFPNEYIGYESHIRSPYKL